MAFLEGHRQTQQAVSRLPAELSWAPLPSSLIGPLPARLTSTLDMLASFIILRAGSNMLRLASVVLLIASIAVLLVACGGTSLRSVGVAALKDRVEHELSHARVRRHGIPASVGGYRNSSIPQEMADEYEVCVFWRDNFNDGAAWGWVLVADDCSTYILELGIDWADGTSTSIIDRW